MCCLVFLGVSAVCSRFGPFSGPSFCFLGCLEY